MSRRTIRSSLSGSFASVKSISAKLSLSGLRIRNTRFLEVSLLLMILFIAFAVRLLPIRWGEYLAEYDTYFQLRMATYMVENGIPAWFSWFDPMTWYPNGRFMGSSAYPGLGLAAALIYWGLGFLGVKASLLTIALVFPVVMGTLTCLVVYYLGKDIGGKGVGLFSGLFLALNSSFISRTALGFFDDETIGIPGMALAFLCFLRSIELDKPLKNRLAYSIIAALSLSAVTASWGAARFVPAIIALYSFLMLLLGRYSRNMLVSYSIVMGVSYSLAALVPVLGKGYLTEIDSLGVLGLIPFMSIYEFLAKADKPGSRRVAIAAVAVTAIGVIILLERTGMLYSLPGKFWGIINPWFRTGIPLVESVAEHRRSSWASFFRDFGVVLSLSLVGTYFTVRRLEPKKLFLLLYFLTTLYFAGSMIRITLILSVSACIMGAYGLVELTKPFMDIVLGGGQPASSRGRRLAPRTSPELGAVFIAALFLTISPTILNSLEQAYTPGQLACSAVPARLTGGGYPQDWIEALTWMRNNLNSSTIVVSWWDYGHWLSGIANVTSLADGSTLDNAQISNIARIFMFNQTDSLRILKSYNADYIVVFVAYNPSEKQQGWPPVGPDRMWPLGDNVKWYWMAQISGLNASDYTRYDSVARETVWTSKFKETTLYNLMFETADSTKFKEVFSSSFGFVLMYKIQYGA